jgi:UDP-N-acetylglucosamine:LPS N-acetylglucosamine transferase
MVNNEFNFYIGYLKGLFKKADYHIQTEPVCCYGDVDVLIPPISRKPRTSSTDIWKVLNPAEKSPVVMITMGGIPQHYTIQNRLREHEKITFVISGGNQSVQRLRNVVILPYRSEFYHPDLIHASDVVVGKAGYSTLAEVYDAGVPFIFIKRSTFRESEIMATYIQTHIASIDITENQFEKGLWISQLAKLLSSPKQIRNGKPGAQQAAQYIYQLLWSQK